MKRLVKPDPTQTRSDQSGFASLYVSLIIVAIMSMILSAFALAVNNEYTQGADRQARYQAESAAETGLNDARFMIYNRVDQLLTEGDSSGGTTVSILQQPFSLNMDGSSNILYDCGDGQNNSLLTNIPGINPAGNVGQLNQGDTIAYTCIRVKDNPLALIYDEMPKDKSEHILVQTRKKDTTSNGFSKANASFIKLEWSASQPNPKYGYLKADDDTNASPIVVGHNYKLPAYSNWRARAPMLRVQLIPLNARSGFNRIDLENHTQTYFLYPSLGGDRTAQNQYPDSAIIDPYSSNTKDSSTSLTGGQTLTLRLQQRADTLKAFSDDYSFTSYEYAEKTVNSGTTTGLTCDSSWAINWLPGQYLAGLKIPPNKDIYYCFRAKYGSNNWLYARIKIDPTELNAGTDLTGKIIAADCDQSAEFECRVALRLTENDYYLNNQTSDVYNNIETPPQGVTAHDEIAYVVLVRPIYGPAKVRVSASINHPGTQTGLSLGEFLATTTDDLHLINQQVQVTASARAAGILYRTREVLPIWPKYVRPEHAIDSAESVCKIIVGNPDTGVQLSSPGTETIHNIYQPDNSAQSEQACQFYDSS